MRILPSRVISYQYNTFGEEFYKGQYSDTSNHVITIGVTPFMEIGGRLTEYRNPEEIQANGVTAGKRDLSANVKVRLPKLSDGFPNFAIGANDIAGEAVNFRSQYIVGTKDFSRGAFSLGYGAGSNTEMDGLFGSLQYGVTSDLSIMAEYTSDKYNIGMTYDFSRLLKAPVVLTASMPLGSESDELDDLVLGVSVSRTLNGDVRNNRISRNTVLSFKNQGENIDVLLAALEGYGLEGLSVGKVGKNELIIAYENKVYNHSYLDGLALVIGTALEHADHNKVISVVILDNKISKLAVRFPLNVLKGYFEKNDPVSKSQLQRSLRAWYPRQAFLSSTRIKWLAGKARKNKTWFDLSLQPKIRTAIGTEWSVGEYSLAARADLEVPLWRGGSAHLGASVPVSNSDLYDDGKIFGSQQHQPGLKEALVQQVFKPSRTSVVVGSAGLMDVQDDLYYTVQSEASVSSSSGNTSVYAKLATFESKDDGVDVDTLLASIRQELPKYGIGAELGYGQFFEGDKGIKLDLNRHLGSADVSAYIKYIDKNDIEGGLKLTFPLTPRKDFKRGSVVVRGNERWSYGQGSTIEDPISVGSNAIRYNKLHDPSPSKTVRGDYLDNGRLSPAYLKANLQGLREAYVNLR